MTCIVSGGALNSTRSLTLHPHALMQFISQYMHATQNTAG